MQLHEEDELIWNDGVAPETAIDFDAPHMSPRQVLAWWLGGFAFFAGVYQFAKSTNHPAKKPSVREKESDPFTCSASPSSLSHDGFSL